MVRLRFGKYAESFSKSTSEDYINLWTDIHRSLASYINIQQDKSIPNNLQLNPIANNYLINPDHFLERANRASFNSLRKHIEQNTTIDIINFNYTSTFEKLYNWSNGPRTISNNNKYAALSSITHIHGTTQRCMILGVDNENQIICSDGLNKMSRIRHRLIKPIANKNTQTLRERDCAKRIAEANIICIFGMSIGLTDQTWWKLIYERLETSPDARLIIFARNNEIAEGLEFLAIELQEAKVNNFIKAAGVTPMRATKVMSKINIAFNSDIFSSFSGIATTRDPISGFEILEAVS